MDRIGDVIARHEALHANCKVCDGTGWVCENHPDKPWAEFSNRDDACNDGPGELCQEDWADPPARGAKED